MSTTTTETKTAHPRTEGWSSLRNSDGSPLIISFDWYDDHSGWRLEDLQGQIEEANRMLENAGEKPEKIDSLHELEALVRSLRSLFRNRDVTDAIVRRGLELADDLDVPNDIQSFDSSINYDEAIVYLTEVLEAWDAAHSWTWTEEDWHVSAVAQLEKAQRARDGLGDRWTIRVSDETVELPGIDIHGFDADETTRAVFDALTALNNEESELGNIASILSKVDKSALNTLQIFGDCFERADITVQPVTVEKMISVTRSLSDEDLDTVTQTIEALAAEWHDTNEALIETAVALLHDMITV